MRKLFIYQNYVMSLLPQYLILTAVLLKAPPPPSTSSSSSSSSFLRQMVENLSHHHSGISVEFDGVLEHLLVGIKCRAM